MRGYEAFASYYDQFTKNVDYYGKAAYIHQLFAYYGVLPKTMLDLACGTGSLTYELAALGYEMIGTDGSAEMLAVASSKAPYATARVQFLSQKMEDLLLPEAVDAAVCTLDSINHLKDQEALNKTFHALGKNIKTKGFFIFDVNSLYKQQQLLGDGDYIFEEDGVYLGWQNRYFEQDDMVEIKLDFFEEQPDGSYNREEETFRERYFSKSVLKTALEANGFVLKDVFGEDRLGSPSLEEERLVYVAQKTE